jgi:hypothetical protein
VASFHTVWRALAIIVGRVRKQGPGSAHNKCDWDGCDAHIIYNWAQRPFASPSLRSFGARMPS